MGNTVLARVLLIILSLVLFLSLVTFGLAFGTDRTILNAGFVTARTDKLEVAGLVNEVISRETAGDLSPDARDAISNAVTRSEPRLKDELRAAILSIYDYLHGKRADPDLATVLRSTFLKSEIIGAFIDNLDVVRIARTEVNKQLDKEPAIPPEVMPSLKAGLEDSLRDLEPWMKSELKRAADPIADYILGRRADFTVTVDLQSALGSVKESVRNALRQSPPVRLANVPAAQFNAEFDRYYAEFSSYVPVAVEFDQTLISPDIPASVRATISDTEAVLRDIREGTRYVRLALIVSLIVALITILIMLLISRPASSGILGIGVAFLLAGIALLIGTLTARNSLNTSIVNSINDAPVQLKTWMPQFVSDVAALFTWTSVVYIVAGIVLIVVSFVFRQRYLARHALEHHAEE